MKPMSYFAKQLTRHMEKNQVTKYRLAVESGYGQAGTVEIVNGKRRPTEYVIECLANSKSLGLGKETLLSWRAVDDYGIQILRKAVKEYKKE